MSIRLCPAAPRSWSRSITWHLLCHLPHLPSPGIPGLALSHGQTAAGARLCPGPPAGQGAAPGESMRGIPIAPRGEKVPHEHGEIAGGEDLTRLEEGVKIEIIIL